MKTLTENQKIWLAALRSGKYEQGNSRLNCNGRFCCLGVAAEIFKTEDTEVEHLNNGIVGYNTHTSLAPPYVVEALSLYTHFGDTISEELKSLASLNDNGKTFVEIADIFESNLEAYTDEL